MRQTHRNVAGSGARVRPRDKETGVIGRGLGRFDPQKLVSPGGRGEWQVIDNSASWLAVCWRSGSACVDPCNRCRCACASTSCSTPGGRRRRGTAIGSSAAVDITELGLEGGHVSGDDREPITGTGGKATGRSADGEGKETGVLLASVGETDSFCWIR